MPRKYNKIPDHCVKFKNTVLIGSEGVADIACQISQHARYVYFILNLVTIAEQSDFEGFKEYVEESYQKNLIPDSVKRRFMEMTETQFKYKFLRTFFSHDPNYYTIYIYRGGGFEITPKITKTRGMGLYWHFTVNEKVRSGTKTRGVIDRVPFRCISKMCGGTEEDFLLKINISEFEQIAYDYFIFSPYAKVTGMFISVNRSTTMEDIQTLLKGTREQKLDVLCKIKHRLSTQSVLDTNTNKLIEFYQLDPYAYELYEERTKNLPMFEVSEIESNISKLRNLVQVRNKMQYSTNQALENFKRHGLLKIGNEIRSVDKKTANALARRGNYMYSFFRYFIIKSVYEASTVKDFVCNIHNQIYKDLKEAKSKRIKNYKKINQLEDLIEVLCFIVPEYATLIHEATGSGTSLRTLVNREDVCNESNNLLSGT